MRPTADEALREAARGGICGSCDHARAVVSARGSAFLRCAHPVPPKYPHQPVMHCGAHAPRPPR